MARVLAALGCIFLTACISGKAPVSDHSTGSDAAGAKTPQAADAAAGATMPDKHLIMQGDTLYAIAWRYGLDFNALASWNKLQPPYVIYAGKSLRLRPPQGRDKAAPRSAAKAPPGASATATVADKPLRWSWPLQSATSMRKSNTGQLLLAVPAGQPVYAAAPGRIVYSGSNIRGYGKLLIIKHNNEFISAYGHNSSLLVQEGQTVKGGQKIAKSGAAPGDLPALYFEIRRYGKQTNTIKYLPPPR